MKIKKNGIEIILKTLKIPAMTATKNAGAEGSSKVRKFCKAPQNLVMMLSLEILLKKESLPQQ